MELLEPKQIRKRIGKYAVEVWRAMLDIHKDYYDNLFHTTFGGKIAKSSLQALGTLDILSENTKNFKLKEIYTSKITYVNFRSILKKRQQLRLQHPQNKENLIKKKVIEKTLKYSPKQRIFVSLLKPRASLIHRVKKYRILSRNIKRNKLAPTTCHKKIRRICKERKKKPLFHRKEPKPLLFKRKVKKFTSWRFTLCKLNKYCKEKLYSIPFRHRQHKDLLTYPPKLPPGVSLISDHDQVPENSNVNSKTNNYNHETSNNLSTIIKIKNESDEDEEDEQDEERIMDEIEMLMDLDNISNYTSKINEEITNFNIDDLDFHFTDDESEKEDEEIDQQDCDNNDEPITIIEDNYNQLEEIENEENKEEDLEEIKGEEILVISQYNSPLWFSYNQLCDHLKKYFETTTSFYPKVEKAVQFLLETNKIIVKEEKKNTWLSLSSSFLESNFDRYKYYFDDLIFENKLDSYNDNIDDLIEEEEDGDGFEETEEEKLIKENAKNQLKYEKSLSRVIRTLPDEILFSIFKFLPTPSILSVSLVCFFIYFFDCLNNY